MAKTDWQASSLRIALFTQQALPLTTDIFTQFAGEMPDRQEDRPKEGIRSQIGKMDDAELTANINPIMADFVLTPTPLTTETVLGDLSSWSLGELREALAKFERRTLAWLPKWEVATTRVSLVIQARANAKSVKDAYAILNANLSSVKVVPGEMTDLNFRVNWKAKTKTIEQGYYNRVTTWTALTLRTTAAGGTGEVPLQEIHFAQVLMDINTPGDRAEPLPREKLPNIYKEFFQLALKIADTGEGP